MNKQGFYAVGVWVPSMRRIITTSTFAQDAEEARSRVEIEGFAGNGLVDGEKVEYVTGPLRSSYLPDDYAEVLADTFNAGYEQGSRDAAETA